MVILSDFQQPTTPIYKTNGFKIGVGVAVVAGCAVLAVVAFPGVAVVTGAAVGSAIGAVSGGFIGGITAETKGGNFIDGFAEGMLVGAIGGAFSGAVGEATVTAGIVVSMVANGVTDSAIYAGETAYRGGEIKAQGLAVSFLTGAVLSGVTRISVGKYGKSDTEVIKSGSETNIDGAINNGQPLNNHRIAPDTDASSLPATKQTPNSSADLLNPDGSVKQRRYYGADGKAQMDIDFNHTDDGTHEFLHIHIWDWSKKPPRQDSRN